MKLTPCTKNLCWLCLVKPLTKLVLITLSCTLFTSPTLAETNFDGSLTKITITDKLGANSPPLADLTYTLNGSTLYLDASTSK